VWAERARSDAVIVGGRTVRQGPHHSFNPPSRRDWRLVLVCATSPQEPGYIFRRVTRQLL